MFDDRGLQNSWSSELTDARVPYGFTKKGAGTLTLTTAPTHTTLTTIEDGTLVVPQGTTIAALSLAGGKLTVPLAGTEDETEVLTISSLADGTTVEALTAAVTVAGVTVSVESGASGYVVKASRTAQTFTWTGAADTAWETGANWTVGGVVASTAPLAVDAVVFPANDDGWSVTISADAVASNIVFNANAEIAAGTCKITTTEISGSGKLTAKGLKLRAPANSNLSIYAPVEIPEGYVFETSVSTQYKHVHLYSKVTGAGTWNMNQDSTNQRGSVQFRGDNGADMSEFAGSLVVINKGSAIRDQTAIYGAIASSSNAVWTLYGFEKDTDSDSSLLKNKDTTYFFGALNGYVCAAGKNATDNINNVWEIGAREDANSVLSGNFFCNGYPNLSASRGDTIRKVGAGSTLTFSGSRVRAYEANAGVLKLASANALLTTWDGGSYAPSIAFNGGTLKLDESVTLDVSTNIAKVASTSAIAFDDEGIDRTWEVELPGTGGLVKKGDGTLTLSEKPLYTGLTTVEAGTLVVPETFTEIVYNPLSAGTLTGVAPTSFAYPAGTTLTGAVASTKNLAGTLSIANVTAVDASAATLEKGQAYVVASATAITGYTRSSLAALPLTLPDGTDPDQWVLKVTTVGGKRALCVAPKIRPTCIFIR